MAIDPLIAELYRAFMERDRQKVLQLCPKPEDPLRILMNKRKDTVLHLALYYMHVDLVLDLLSDEYWPPSQRRMLIHQNSSGNTILHEAATHDDCIKAAKRILELEPDLINIRNGKGEPPIFRAVRYGQIKMFKFLDRQVQHVPQTPAQRLIFYENRDGATILHVAIYNEHYELAHYIAKKHKYLVGEKNEYKMTGLQILATKPSAFKNPKRGWLKHLIRIRPLDAVEVEDEDGSLNEHEGETILISTEDEDGFLDEEKGCRVLWWDRIHKECRRYEAAVELANFLVREDTTWIESDNVKPKPNSSSPLYEQSPLILATKWGCLEIVDQILTLHPQTVEQVDSQYGSILHLAIKYRQINVFNKVLEMNMPLRRLVRKDDDKGNSILHMVGENMTADDDQSTKKKGRNGTPPSDSDSDEEEEKMTEDDYQSTKKKGRYTSNTSDLEEKKGRYTRNPSDLQEIDNETRSPAFELQDDLLLFERVEEILKNNFHKDVNFKGQTPEQLFALNKEKLRRNAQKWLRRTAGSCSIVAVPIATVAFAAAYTVPGGSKDDGTPALINQTFFVVFTICDVLSLTFTLTAIILFLSILTSSFRLQDFKVSLPQKLMLGITCLIFSVSMMMLAFTATIILMINNKERWTKITMYTVAFLPVTVLAATYLPLCIALTRTFKYTFKKIRSIFPEFRDIPSKLRSKP